MDKSIRIQKCLLSQKLSASILDTITFAITTLLLYITILYGVFGTFFNYVSDTKQIKEIENTYNLNLKKNLDYKEYELVIKDFYLHFEEEIENEYNEIHETNFTVQHIYNTIVLRLPVNPTPDNFKTTYYQYVQKSTGEIDPDQFAKLTEGSGKVYEKNMHDIYYSAYTKLKALLEKYDETYSSLKIKKYNKECYSRIIAFILAFVIYFVIYPSKNLYYLSFFERKKNIAYVNQIDGYLTKKYKILLKRILVYIIPFIGFIGFSKYAVIILIIGSLFLNYLILLFSAKNNEIPENLLKIESCSIDESLLFKNYNDEVAYFQKEEAKEINDIDFLNRLESISNISIPNQHTKK
jgi:hypothetical protein